MNLYDIIGLSNHEEKVIPVPDDKRKMTKDEYDDLFGLVKEMNLKMKNVNRLDVKNALERIAVRLQEEE